MTKLQLLTGILVALLAGCAMPVSKHDLAAIKRVAVVSIIPDEIEFTRQGPILPISIHQSVNSVPEWAISRSLRQHVEKKVGKKWTVVEIDYDEQALRREFSKPNVWGGGWPNLHSYQKQAVASAIRGQTVDAVILLEPRGWPLGNVGAIGGLGVIRSPFIPSPSSLKPPSEVPRVHAILTGRVLRMPELISIAYFDDAAWVEKPLDFDPTSLGLSGVSAPQKEEIRQAVEQCGKEAVDKVISKLGVP